MKTNFDNVIIDIKKLRDYCLNLNHPIGKHKAIVFKNKLGLTSDDADEMKTIIAEQIKFNEVKEDFSDEYGKRFYIDVSLTRLNNTETIRTLWMVRKNEIVPRFVSCYIKN